MHPPQIKIICYQVKFPCQEWVISVESLVERAKWKAPNIKDYYHIFSHSPQNNGKILLPKIPRNLIEHKKSKTCDYLESSLLLTNVCESNFCATGGKVQSSISPSYKLINNNDFTARYIKVIAF